MRKFFMVSVVVASLSLGYLTAVFAKEVDYQSMPAGEYALDDTHASLTWKVSHLGLSDYTARFTKFDVNISFDPKDITNSKVTATIDPRSLRTDYPNADKKDFDKKLSEGKKWFNAGQFGAITFESTKVELTKGNQGKLIGDLTFLGVTKPVTLDFTLNGAMVKQPFSKLPTLGFSAQGKIKRSDWGMATYVPNIGDEVTLLIEAEFAKNK